MKIALTDVQTHAVRGLERALKSLGSVERIDVLDGDTARKREPQITNEVMFALDFPEAAQVSPTLLISAVAIAAERRGVQFLSGKAVQAIEHNGNEVRAVVAGDQRVACEHVVVAAGSWTSLVPGLGLAANAVFPVRGQIVSTTTRPPVVQRVVFGPRGYVLSRPDGTTLVGATEEHVGFERGVTLGGVSHVVQAGIEVAPSIEHSTLLNSWSNFRPCTPDKRPIVGRAPGVDRLYIASGHYRSGILLAPITAAWLADAITTGTMPASCNAWRPERFLTTLPSTKTPSPTNATRHS